ncbi:hypothetical protein RIF29_34224 [Crotalaria pallida]|uniref:Uncharacterized protein n=1 Tax=Crotalaria pallida TaxID=3830 RepID=A0AAN9E903_CROPI
MLAGGLQLSACSSVVVGPPKVYVEDEYLKFYPKKTIESVNSCPEAIVADNGVYYCHSCSRHVYNVTPRELRQLSIQVDFKSLVGRKLLFKVANTSVSSPHHSGIYRVRGVCDDPNIIAMYELPGVDISPNKDGSIAPANVSNLEVGDMSACYSQIAGYDEEVIMTAVCLDDDSTPSGNCRPNVKHSLGDMLGETSTSNVVANKKAVKNVKK